MRRIILFSFIILSFSSFHQKKTRVLFFGDSLTELGARPGGYIPRIDSLARLENKSGQFELMGSGISGNKVYDLYLRMEEDVLSKDPDIVFIYVGINDIWHKVLLGTGTDPDKFEKFYAAIIKKLQDRKIKVILATPSLIGEKTDMTNQQDGELNSYGNIVRDLAKKNDLPLVDLRQKMMEYLKDHNPQNKDRGILTYDRVHFIAAGNELIAEEFWKVLKRQ